MENIPEKVELKKHISAIHSASKMSLIERKITNALLFNAYDDLLKKEAFHISIKELCKLIQFDSNDQGLIKKKLLSLMSIVIEWNVIDSEFPSKSEWNACPILAGAKIKGSLCTYFFSPNLKELFYKPSIYGRLDMSVLGKFKSVYALVLYENCCRYQNIKQTPWLSIPVFRKLMGIEPDKYLIFRDLKRRVIDSSILEINKISSLKITPEFKKENRQVVAVKFYIEATYKSFETNKLINQKPLNIDDENLILKDKLVIKFKLDKKQAEHLLNQYGESYILEKIEYVIKSQSYLNGKIKNIASYLVKAIQDNYQLPKNVNGNNSLEPSLKNKNTNIDVYKRNDDKSKIYSEYVDNMIFEETSNLSDNIKNKIFEDFKLYLSSNNKLKNLLEEFEKNKLNIKEVRAVYNKFFLMKHIKLLPNLIPFPDFII